jgi:hypothetical protein
MSVGSIHLHALPYAWPQLWPMLEPVAKRIDKTESDVRRVIESGHAQLWAIAEKGKPIAAVVTQITLEPEKRCLMWLIGGDRAKEWAGDFLARIEAFAREWGCVALWGAGRKGWARIVEPAGFVRVADVDGLPTWEKKIHVGGI